MQNMGARQLLKGALASAISSASGLIIALQVIDPMRFSVASIGGWKHLGEAIGIVVLISEARFWKKWSDAVLGTTFAGASTDGTGT